MYIQVASYYSVYSISFPASLSIVNTELVKFVEFENINPEKLYQHFDPDFSIKSLFGNITGSIGEQSDQVTLYDDFEIFFILGAILLAVMLLMSILYVLIPGFREDIAKHFNDFIKGFFWNGAIQSLQITFLKNCIAVRHQMVFYRDNQRKSES